MLLLHACMYVPCLHANIMRQGSYKRKVAISRSDYLGLQ